MYQIIELLNRYQIYSFGRQSVSSIWNSILKANITYYGLNLNDSAPVFASLNIFRCHTGPTTWDTKFKYWTGSPHLPTPVAIVKSLRLTFWDTVEGMQHFLVLC